MSEASASRRVPWSSVATVASLGLAVASLLYAFHAQRDSARAMGRLEARNESLQDDLREARAELALAREEGRGRADLVRETAEQERRRGEELRARLRAEHGDIEREQKRQLDVAVADAAKLSRQLDRALARVRALEGQLRELKSEQTVILRLSERTHAQVVSRRESPSGFETHLGSVVAELTSRIEAIQQQLATLPESGEWEELRAQMQSRGDDLFLLAAAVRMEEIVQLVQEAGGIPAATPPPTPPVDTGPLGAPGTPTIVFP